MNKITVKDSEQCTVTFEHCMTHESSSYTIMQNPLTGNWLQTHKVGDKETSYYSNKKDAVKLANDIVKKTTKLGLPVTVDIQPRTVLPGK
jgi:hypothetical protein